MVAKPSNEKNSHKIKLLSIILPVFNESESIEHTIKEINEQVKECEVNDYEIYVVDDGSVDDTLTRLETISESQKNLNIICFNRNFGKEAAIHAGLQYSQGDAAILMDADGQHPFSLIPTMVKKWTNGAQVVAACKSNRGDESIVTKMFSHLFYSLFKFLTKIDIRNLSDFMLLDREVIDRYCDLPERQRFFRGMINWMGFNTEKVTFDVEERKQGQTSWSKIKLLRLAINATTAFSSTPLHCISFAAVLYVLFAFLLGLQTLYMVFSGNAETGFTTVILLILITGGLIMFGLGQIGLYIEQIFDEIKSRPTYIINKSKSHLPSEHK